MAQLLVSKYGDILLNRGQVQALLEHANAKYTEDPWNFSGHGISHLFPLTLEKLSEAYEEDHIKVYLDGVWMGVSLPQVCIIPKPFMRQETQDSEWWPICMDDGWVDYIRDRAVSAIARVLDVLN